MHIPPLIHNLGDVTDHVSSGAPDSVQEVNCSRTVLKLSTGFHNETSWELRPWELLSCTPAVQKGDQGPMTGEQDLLAFP